MNDKKIKIVDLLKDLGGATEPEVKQVLKEMNSSAKTQVAPEEADKLRTHFAEIEKQKEAQSKVIVRRRPRKDEQPEQEQHKPAQVQAQAEKQPEAPAKPAAEAQEAPKPASPRAKSAKEVRASAPVARVISRPQDVLAAKLAAEKAAAEEAAKLAAEQAAQKAAAAAEKAAEKAAAQKAAEQKAQEAPKQEKARVIRHVQAEASAMPEGSSAPTLPQRTAEAAEAPKAQQPAAPQVRIISRPTPEAQARTQENRAREQQQRDSNNNRPYRPGGAPRPQGDRPGGFPRPGGAPRPQGDRPSGPRPGGFAPRPQGAGFGAAPAPADLAGRGDQSKKKRNKNVKRTVDFGGQGDFGRRSADDDDGSRMNRSRGRRKGGKAPVMPTNTQPLKAAKRKIRVTEAIRVADMAHQMGLKANEIIKILFNLGMMATINQALDIETATLVASEFGYEVEKAGFAEEDYIIPTEADTPEQLTPRPPVVTIMGHVDHGKTSLLDAIRKTSVTSGEAGGITQHIGAYHVKTKRGDIVFLDTPGHEAFTAMRARGAQVTDLVILVVAADDGVMEQTREAINHSRAAGVPIMVAVNKIDKPGANPERVLRELAEFGLQAEDWGGDTVTAMVSAKTRQGLDELLELVALQAEILELKANPNKPARGHIVEAKLDKGRGPVATVLIQEGTLKQGDNFVCGVFSGRVRALFNDQGKKVKEAGPSMPVEVQGFDGVAEAGEEFICVNDEKVARRIAETRATKQRERALACEHKVTLETFLASKASDEEALNLNLLVKADVQGSVEAINAKLTKMSTEKVKIAVVHSGAGAISESDIMLAAASQAIVLGFNVRPTAKVKEVAERENVEVRFYDIIYKLEEEITSAMTGMLAPVQREEYLGQTEVRNTFSVPKVGVIAGCYVIDGKLARNAGVRLLRDGVVIYTGKISSLKRFKDDAKEVMKGNECGVGLENYNDIKVGDIIEAFVTVEEAATL